MYTDPRPLDTLASYAIAFVSGLLAAAALSGYIDWVRKQAAANATAADTPDQKGT